MQIPKLEALLNSEQCIIFAISAHAGKERKDPIRKELETKCLTLDGI